MLKWLRWGLLILLILPGLSGMLAAPAQAQQRVAVGVLAFQDKAETLARWQPTADWLGRQIPGYRFEVLPLGFAELDAAVAQARVDFVLTNPQHFVVLSNPHGLRALATLRRAVQGQDVDRFGSVIFTRANTAWTQLADLRQRRIAAVGQHSLGGFLMAADAFRKQGMDLVQGRDAEMLWTGVPHSRVVEAVMQGQADAGIVRTGVIEDMIAAGQLAANALRVLNPQPQDRFPQRLSTELYPEWPWAALRHPPDDLVKAVTRALLRLGAGASAARSGGYQGFTAPANYFAVEALMHRLKAYPGLRERPVWQALWEDHPAQVQTAVALLLLLGLGQAVYFWRSNRTLRELTRVNREAQAGLEVAAAAFDSQVGLVVTDAQFRIKRANPALTELLGYREGALNGQSTAVLRGHSLPAKTLRHIWGQVQVHGRWQGELACLHRSGADVTCMVTLTRLGQGSSQNGFVGSFVDISAKKRAEEDIRRLAYFDPLTQLPNRRMFLEALETAKRQALMDGTLAGLMFIDLDFFKNLNDAHGHSVGDQLLYRIAERLRLLLGPHDLAARLGGDEFVVMLPRLSTEEAVALEQTLAMAQTIHQALLSPFELDTTGDFESLAQSLRYTCSGSIGVTLFGMVDEPLTDVLKRADVAMYKAKQDGRNLVRSYDPAAQKAVNDRMALSNDLNLALRDGQFQLLYQLQVDARDAPVGAECLMRWMHPTRGSIPPALFIALAEDSGAIVAMGDWVLHSACQTLARWAATPALTHLTLSVNVSPRQFTEADFVERVSAILQETGARAQRLRLELTEGIVMQDPTLVVRRMQALCALGLSFSVDDFGTGYSSLSYMQMLPLAEIKIDKTFVSNLTSNERSEAIVRAVIALGHSMGIEIVSEGVETPAQRDRLRALGCPLMQGYLFGKPMPCEELEALVRRVQPDPAPPAPAGAHASG